MASEAGRVVAAGHVVISLGGDSVVALAQEDVVEDGVAVCRIIRQFKPEPINSVVGHDVRVTNS